MKLVIMLVAVVVLTISVNNAYAWGGRGGGGDGRQDDLQNVGKVNNSHHESQHPYGTVAYTSNKTGRVCVPEPTTLLMLGIGLFGLAIRRYSK